jgi:hypothetical protein
MIFGTPDFVCEEIKRHILESGCNYFVPRFAFGNLTQEEILRSYDLFVKEVMPHFKDREPAKQAVDFA